MAQDAIFSPFFATVFLKLLVWVYIYIRHISFITSRKLHPKDLAAPGKLAQISLPNVSNPLDSLKNLFEIPVLFYALVSYVSIMKQVDVMYVNAAWVFVAFCALHSVVHCASNFVMLRFYLYLFATLTVSFIAMRVTLIHFNV
ncbi:MAPEG family protein [Leptolyngbya sp. FACHB-261]|nr:MAPEG family protein [Leptolyngbya sp. FACHB-261]